MVSFPLVNRVRQKQGSLALKETIFYSITGKITSAFLGKIASALTFVELSVGLKRTRSRESGITIRVDNRLSIEIQQNFDSSSLQTILRVLGIAR